MVFTEVPSGVPFGSSVSAFSATLLVRVGRTNSVVIDLLFTSRGIEPEIVSHAVPVEVVPELTMPVAQLGHLLAKKVLSHDLERPPGLEARRHWLLG